MVIKILRVRRFRADRCAVSILHDGRISDLRLDLKHQFIFAVRNTVARDLDLQVDLRCDRDCLAFFRICSGFLCQFLRGFRQRLSGCFLQTIGDGAGAGDRIDRLLYFVSGVFRHLDLRTLFLQLDIGRFFDHAAHVDPVGAVAERKAVAICNRNIVQRDLLTGSDIADQTDRSGLRIYDGGNRIR